MKEFNSETERKYLRILLKMNENIELNLGSFLSFCILENDRIIQLDERKVTLVLNIKNENERIFMNDLSIIVSLIETLKDEKLIFTHNNPEILKRTLSKKSDKPLPYHLKKQGVNVAAGLTNDKDFQTKIFKNSSHYGKWELPTTLANYILEYVDTFCYVRPELVEYIENDFKTPEQLRFSKTLFYTQIASIIAFVGLIIAIIIPLLTSSTINKTQYDNILQKVEIENQKSFNQIKETPMIRQGSQP